MAMAPPLLNLLPSKSQVGYVPGNILYFVFGCAAGYTGLVLWRLFLALDSARYPIKTYSDIAERIFGRPARHVVTVLQVSFLSFQL